MLPMFVTRGAFHSCPCAGSLAAAAQGATQASGLTRRSTPPLPPVPPQHAPVEASATGLPLVVGAVAVRVSADAGLVARTNALASLPSPASQPSGSVLGSRPASATV